MTRKKWIVTVLAAGLVGLAGWTVAANNARPDCPGQIICPLTGKLVCKDRCPLNQGTHADGVAPAEKPSCCRKGN